MSTNNILLKAKKIKNVYYGVGAFMVAQLLYFPANYKYFHLPLLLLTLITVDLYEFKYRDYDEEYKILGSLLGCSFIAILDKYTNIDLKIVYYFFLLVAIYFNYKLMSYSQQTFSLKSEMKRINDRNKKLYKDNGKFMKIYFIIIKFVLIVTVGYLIIDVFGLVNI